MIHDDLMCQSALEYVLQISEFTTVVYIFPGQSAAHKADNNDCSRSFLTANSFRSVVMIIFFFFFPLNYTFCNTGLFT